LEPHQGNPEFDQNSHEGHQPVNGGVQAEMMPLVVFERIQAAERD
jgi:hypothetical protein